MWGIVILIILNIICILRLSYRIQQLENEKEEIYSESIKELNKLRNEENKNVK